MSGLPVQSSDHQVITIKNHNNLGKWLTTRLLSHVVTFGEGTVKAAGIAQEKVMTQEQARTNILNHINSGNPVNPC